MKDKVKAWIESEYQFKLKWGDSSSASHATDRC